jgi:hypothetical protein
MISFMKWERKATNLGKDSVGLIIPKDIARDMGVEAQTPLELDYDDRIKELVIRKKT